MKISYSKEIDSLRALAVLAVIIYHVKIPFLEGIYYLAVILAWILEKQCLQISILS